jgi:hypothetical protein
MVRKFANPRKLDTTKFEKVEITFPDFKQEITILTFGERDNETKSTFLLTLKPVFEFLKRKVQKLTNWTV